MHHFVAQRWRQLQVLKMSIRDVTVLLLADELLVVGPHGEEGLDAGHALVYAVVDGREELRRHSLGQCAELVEVEAFWERLEQHLNDPFNLLFVSPLQRVQLCLLFLVQDDARL